MATIGAGSNTLLSTYDLFANNVISFAPFLSDRRGKYHQTPESAAPTFT